ncbi:DoxX family protein [Streptomyces sp. P38-E01]|uniref:DoxX family protein n=1 Tax=Streptomyces tardus TaxID=2780544 RepID=A0A949N457_9ACTN|nr:DoxX family protein [Streptomyces tardus]MBU7597559.1 DoxX family protein [Streptomyces tardus]
MGQPLSSSPRTTEAPDESRDRIASVLDPFQPHVLSAFRVVVGLLFACHGAATLFDVLGGPASGQGPAVAEWPGWWAAAIQLGGGILVLAGVFTRPAALLCSGSMAYAYFVEHQSEGLFPIENGGNLSALYCWAFFLIAVFGPGRWTVTSVLQRARSAR